MHGNVMIATNKCEVCSPGRQAHAFKELSKACQDEYKLPVKTDWREGNVFYLLQTDTNMRRSFSYAGNSETWSSDVTATAKQPRWCVMRRCSSHDTGALTKCVGTSVDLYRVKDLWGCSGWRWDRYTIMSRLRSRHDCNPAWRSHGRAIKFLL